MFRVQCVGFRVLGFGFQVPKVRGLGSRVHGLVVEG